LEELKIFEREKFIAKKMQQSENDLIFKGDYFNKVKFAWWEEYKKQ